MKGFHFEKNLPHQEQAVKSTLAVFDGLEPWRESGSTHVCANPWYNKVYSAGNFERAGFMPEGRFKSNIAAQQSRNGIATGLDGESGVIDIMMETGTGKTYTYTKTIFELNKECGIFKFIVVVPTLPIKAGTVNFMRSESCIQHFKEQYGKTLKLHVVESQKAKKNNKANIPHAISSFVQAGHFEHGSIQVLIINTGMVNSETMRTVFTKNLIDTYNVPFDALAATRPFLIIDEPHKFKQEGETWKNIQRMRAQIVLRYGATFPEKEVKSNKINPLTGKPDKVWVKDYRNLVYQLSAVDAFNQNLVKGITGHITEFDGGKNALIRLVDTDGTEAVFECIEGDKTLKSTVGRRESLHKIHPEMQGLLVESLNKSTVVLSNGLELKKGDKLNPYSYAVKLQDLMLQRAVRNHFQLERSLLKRDDKIKPLTLFFIDNIEEYRAKDGTLRRTLEQCVVAEIKALLETEEDAFFKNYLTQALHDVAATHGGYFSKDNSEKDEAIEREINEIMHDKEALLDFANPRRFIFSKWTLREGWDNPNVFQICKLRSSGSEISKLQEVGRGLRLPVNEFGNRVKNDAFFLHYFVDFTESDFIDKLVSEINAKSGAFSLDSVPDTLSDAMIEKICALYGLEKEALLEVLDANNVITRSNVFKTGGFDFIKQNYPLLFEGVNSNKIAKATAEKKKITVRTEKYQELQTLWEKLNEKVLLEYRFDNEAAFQALLTAFFKSEQVRFFSQGVHETVASVKVQDNQASVLKEPESVYARHLTQWSTMLYSDFLKALAQALFIHIKTLHQAILASGVDVNPYLNPTTVRSIKQAFEDYLMAQAFDKFSIAYQKVSNQIHPTKLTDKTGGALKEVAAADVGVLYAQQTPAPSYYFDALYFDSDLEKTNIQSDIAEVIVFTKIPKNAIKIPVAGGKSYSPDFAYVLKFKGGAQKLHFVVETKNTPAESHLRLEEQMKIKHAQAFFNGHVDIEFKTQFSSDKMVDLIRQIEKQA